MTRTLGMILALMALVSLGACGSNDDLVALKVARPEAPIEVMASYTGPNLIKIIWQDSSENEDGFVIKRASGDFGLVTIGRTKSDEVAFLDSYGNTPHFPQEGPIQYIVRAYNSAGESESAESNQLPVVWMSSQLNQGGEPR